MTPEASATIQLNVTINNEAKATADMSVSTAIFALGDEGRSADSAAAAIRPIDVSVAPRSSVKVEGTAVITNPKRRGPPP